MQCIYVHAGGVQAMAAELFSPLFLLTHYMQKQTKLPYASNTHNCEAEKV